MRRSDDIKRIVEQCKSVLSRDFVVFDTETTDIHGEIVEYALCDKNGQPLLEGRVKPTVPISEGAFGVHGISDVMVSTCPTFDQVAEQVLSPLVGKVVVGYNVAFDLGRLITTLHAYERLKPLAERVRKFDSFCVMDAFAPIYGTWYRGSYRWQKLGVACGYFDIPLKNAHSAMGDVLATYQVLNAMSKL